VVFLSLPLPDAMSASATPCWETAWLCVPPLVSVRFSRIPPPVIAAKRPAGAEEGGKSVPVCEGAGGGGGGGASVIGGGVEGDELDGRGTEPPPRTFCAVVSTLLSLSERRIVQNRKHATEARPIVKRDASTVAKTIATFR